MWYVYVLRSNKDGNTYVGSTNNLQRRLEQHEHGECISTSKRLPITLEAYIAVKTQEQARSLEQYLKTGSGAAILKKRVLLLQ
ncbi:TPA: excinuclease ABC subunit C [Candidatus Peribacteria bacterium]|nr:MAG: excinuclease ABC subunit C [Candidatus Peribacteria bacterium RIFOXYC2_FULL_58_10]OGJ84064.1 MAG: excinuclease ABC subunit C [Candidatus Peribacteria bacterium RIFOXYD2_FULL_58_15]HAI98793.1 excinuclease ABC subunit C [Candidatus Peribacteria bacterium]HAS34086.1 excinuclease ABC subunit C [Candidatus Peribacteria bacterium]